MERNPTLLLRKSLDSGRLHSAYLLSGPGEAPRQAALHFVRGIVCEAELGAPCDRCSACTRSGAVSNVVVDGAGRKGPLHRYVGDHPDLLWVERGPDDTRVRIGQIRALQRALHLRSHEGGRRAAVIADAEWLNQEAQNALLRVVEEPPPHTTLVLVTSSASGLLATLRSRCQRVAFGPGAGPEPGSPEAEAQGEITDRLAALQQLGLPELLDWAEEYRGARGPAAAAVGSLLLGGSRWLRDRVQRLAADGERNLRAELEAFATLQTCRKSLSQRNANPQMVAERALFALRKAATPRSTSASG